MQPPKLKYEVLLEAAKSNFDILQEKNFNLGKFLKTNDASVTSYVSKFKSTKALNTLPKIEPQWEA